ncbi:hypothetical protein BJ138DRAFT_1115163 [Hygrophoropsis aurantiaca]|uniref:Uncharacterized protein n=1 Tax=Hygrophoropsis aurantiaca TaxID=72124 RepID=A0ACB8A7Z6_9AGAM|nr:hypothetical protein BJ138DRAFT_1115163 [Hygrophoropsis aurantiaca]
MSSLTPLHAIDTYTHRAESGLYDAVVDQMIDLPRGTALALSTYEEDFHRVIAPKTSNFMYRSRAAEVEHEGILIGQLCRGTLGSKFNAKGNFFAGTANEPAYIDDKSRIKFLFTLCQPTQATHRMATLWDNQIATLGEVIDSDKEELERAKKQKDTTF